MDPAFSGVRTPADYPGMTRALALCFSALILLLPRPRRPRTLVGTPGKDRLIGSLRAGNVINGDGGGDYIAGGAQNDRLPGEWGGDDVYRPRRRRLPRRRLGRRRPLRRDRQRPDPRRLRRRPHVGGDGNDFIDGQAAGDDIDAGPGDDIVHGGSATDRILGGAGNDSIYSDSGGDLIDAGDGNDTVYVNNGTAVDTVDCGPGLDVLHINPIGMRGGYSNARSLREGRLRNCERILETAPAVDPSKGIKRHDPGRAAARPAAPTATTTCSAPSAPTCSSASAGGRHLGQPQADRRSHGIDRVDAAPATTPSTAPRAAARPTSTAATATTTCRAAARPPPTTSRAARATTRPPHRPRLQRGRRRQRRRHRLRVHEGPHGHRLRPGRRSRQDRPQSQVRTRGCEKVSRRYKK